jgi:hypothetical protein
MSDQSQTAANSPQEPILCKMACGFFVSTTTRVLGRANVRSPPNDATPTITRRDSSIAKKSICCIELSCMRIAWGQSELLVAGNQPFYIPSQSEAIVEILCPYVC